jgi:hypothetical protein
MRKRISPTTTIACLALFFSLAGTGIAASQYLITRTSQIKPSVRAQLRGPRGFKGLQGATGAAGAAGAIGVVNWDHTYFAASERLTVTAANLQAETDVYCHPGDHALTGGFASFAAIVTISEIQPDAYSPDGAFHRFGSWSVVGHFDQSYFGSPSPQDSGWVQAWALCAAG